MRRTLSRHREPVILVHEAANGRTVWLKPLHFVPLPVWRE